VYTLPCKANAKQIKTHYIEDNMPVPFRPDIIDLPENIYDAKEVAAFADSLNGQLDRFGVKKLRKATMSIYWHLKHIERTNKEMLRLLKVVNGQPTEAQHSYYEEKKLRTNAVKFYSTLSLTSLQGHCDAVGINRSDMTKADMEAALVDAHVKREMYTNHNWLYKGEYNGA
jgi:hypothetical protein